MKHLRIVLFAILTGSVATPVRAHFLWLTAEKNDGKPVVEAFLSETPTPDSPAFLKHIANSKITVGDQPLTWTKGEDTYRIELPEPAPKAVDGFCDLGVTKRGESTFRLLYTARVQFAPMTSSDAELTDNLRVRLIARPGNKPIVQVTFKGKPAPAAVVKAYPGDGTSIELKADADGHIDMPGVAEGKTGLLAKWIEKGDGEADGKPFAETRYYSTFTVWASDANAPAITAKASTTDVTQVEASDPNAPFAMMPEAVNSFGGAVSNGWLYVYSGHIGDAHKYSAATTTTHFRRLNLADRTTWEELPCGPALQGVALVAHGGMLYRIGGAAAKNQPGQPVDLTSTAEFARFDPQNGTWSDLPKLPTARSTHDAVVSGDKIYVIGGWSMNRGEASNSEFADDALVFDLAKKDAQWEKLPTPPFQRRALAVAELAGKIYVLGGLTEEGKIVKDVDIYDPESKTWSKGPELMGGRFQGFAASAFGVKGKLYVNGQDGILYRLSDDGKSWEVTGKLAIPRLTHRLLPGLGESVLAVGGNFATSPVRVIESLQLTDVPGPKVIAWTVPTATDARQGQAIGMVRSKLLAVGGNRSNAPHAFQAENLLTDGVEISLSRMDSKAIPPLPVQRQSGVLVVNPSKKSEALLIGGIGPDGDVSRTLGDVYKLDTASGKWSKSNAMIPDARGMFGTAVYKDSIYVFGGSIWDPRPGQEKRKMPVEVLRWDTKSEGSTFEVFGQKSPRGRRSFAGAMLGSKYYMVGGLNDDVKLVDNVDVYDFDTKTWSTAPSPSRPRLFADLASLDGKLYLAGGFIRPEGGHFEPVHSIECFEPATSKWSTVLENSPIGETSIAMLPIQGRLLLYAPAKNKSREARFAIVAP
jgi:N-acetylneuraminic acid mutarotase